MANGIEADDEENNKLATIFLLKESALESFKIALSVLAPVIASLLPGVIKF